ncbi:MAG: hypothetical protein JW776_09755 [Candidatus Lokiarchaeota archaeon]|nr:hypothetical protein [Candidatus Lokiarchaeota archaeon]
MRTKVLLDGIWYFHADPDDIGRDQQWYLEENFQYLERLFTAIVPGCWNQYDEILKDYCGIGWYFKNFEIPRDLVSKKIFLHFEGVNGTGSTEIFLDGKKISTQKGAYSPFKIELTGIISEQSHFLGIRMQSSPDEKKNRGIDRSVYLEYSDWIYIDDNHILQKIEWTPQKHPKSVELTIKSFLRNDSIQEWVGSIEYNITHQKAIISTTKRNFNIQNKNSRLLTTVIIIESPELWSPSSPNPFLYEIHVKVQDSEYHLVDEHYTHIGIREIDSREGKLYINQQELPMHGIKMEYSSKLFCSAIPTIYLLNKLMELRKEGVNLIFLEHLPDKRFLDITDRLGFTVIENADRFEIIDDHAETLIKTMIFRDRNHASVISWKYTREMDSSRSINSELVTRWIRSFEKYTL